jgi:hypothetical protein
MTAPLIPSISSSAATPANTPCLNRETLHRSRHIRRKGDSRAMSRRTSQQTTTTQADAVSSLSTTDGRSNGFPPGVPPRPEGEFEDGIPVAKQMYRLDSHVVSALQALQGEYDSPDLDVALGIIDLHPGCVGDVAIESVREHVEGGLGLGMHIRNDSIYSLSTVSQWRRKCAQPSRLPSDWLTGRSGSSRMGAPVEDGRSAGLEPFMVTDLDTGLTRALTLKRSGDA